MQVTTIIACAFVATTSAIDFDQLKEKHQEKDKGRRIINGDEVIPHSNPWQVFLIAFNATNDVINVCGASIINKQWLLTAAHCLEDGTKTIEAMLGAHNLKDVTAHKHVYSTEYINHKDYKNVNTSGDIALIKLQEPIEFNDNIQPIDLNTEDNVDGMEATIAGWGYQSDEPGSHSVVLRSITVSVMPLSECKQFNAHVFDSIICTNMQTDADGVIMSACHGDSGGPLVVDGKTQIGIASYVIGKCKSGKPNVYTRVSYYIDWINEIIT